MNPIMIDGTGMCGGCRLTVGGETKFACVDGPDFDGHQVDFDEAMKPQHACTATLKQHAREDALQPDEQGGSSNMAVTCEYDTKKCPMPSQEPERPQQEL